MRSEQSLNKLKLEGLAMNKIKYLIMVLMFFVLSVTFPQSVHGRYGGEITDQNDVDSVIDVDSVTIELTHLDVNDTNLKLGFKIINNTDHDVWICDGLHPGDLTERFLDPDAKTLVIRRRFNLPMKGTPISRFFQSSYIRLRSGHEKVDSLFLDVPVDLRRFFGQSVGNAENAIRLVLEIGFYNEDLPGMILQIIDVAEKINCDLSVGSYGIQEISDRFFEGWTVAKIFKYDVDFRESVTSGGDEVRIPYMGQVLHGEQVLRLEVDNVSIPYKSNYPPLTDEPTPSETEPYGVTTVLTKFDVNDTKLELGFKIINNTDHDVWICDDVSVYSTMDFEVYLSEDEQTLLIRKRLDVPTIVYWPALPYGRYIRLRSDKERTESVSLDVPVGPWRLCADGLELPKSDLARRIVLEVGFYNEDLPKLIRDILEMAEEFDCARFENNSKYSATFFARYFKGAWIAQLFGGLSGFEENAYKEGSEEIRIPYSTYSRENFGVEQVLRIEVDGVHIPYDENAPINSEGTSPLPPKGKTCFLAETPVWIDGKIVPISKVGAGQSISKPFCTRPGFYPDRVGEVQEHTGTFECRDIVLESGNHIGVVGAHYFMHANGEWITAKDLKSGLSLRTLQGTIKINSVTVRATPYTGKVYNLKIKNSDEYIVGRDAVIVRDY
jgi:hypothetical protein